MDASSCSAAGAKPGRPPPNPPEPNPAEPNPAERRDSAPYLFHSQTTSLCEHCLALVPTKVTIEGGRVFFLKRCRDHGVQKTLIADDADYWRAQRDWLKPGDRPLAVQTRTDHGCPYDCGLCPDHEQHSCLALVEVNDACNLTCPVCFAESGVCVRGVTFQPIQMAGRTAGVDPRRHRIVLTEIRRRVAEAGVFGLDDLIPLPCNPEQICIGYGLRDGSTVTPVTGLLPREIFVAAVPNTVSFEAYPELRARMFDLLSLSTTQADTTDRLSALLCCLPEVAAPAPIGYENTFRVVISQFLDPYNFDLGTVKRSCVHVVQPDGRIVPFDTYNLFYRDGARGADALALGRRETQPRAR